MSSTLLTILALVGFWVILPAARAQDVFPGVGDKNDWLKGNSSFAEGNHLMKSQKYDQAILKYHAAIAFYPSDPNYHYNLGLALKRKNELAAAADSFKRAIALNQSDWRCWKALGNCQYKQGALSDARVSFEKALACRPPVKEVSQLKAGIAACSSSAR